MAARMACGEIAGGPRGAGRDGALEAVTEFAAMSDALARRIEEALAVAEVLVAPAGLSAAA